MKRATLFAATMLGGMIAASASHASLVGFQQYNGQFAVSTAGFGSLSSSGSITSLVPFGSTVTAAYLYSSTIPGVTSAGGSLNGNVVSYTGLGANSTGLQAFRADVTSIVATVINGGAGGSYNFTVTEDNSGQQDGEALVVVYSNASLPTATVGILDGNSAPTGDTTLINFSTALNPSAPGFFAELRLGDGYSCCSQASTVSINGTTITTNAGNNDDSGITSNGALITVGGDNDPFSPFLPSYADDHERYNIVPYITAGDTTIKIDTLNPSRDDNIFLAVVYISGEGGVNQPPPTSVPEPASLALLGLGLTAFGIARRKRA